jgi:glycosyltransferase involved in cell wall biosynthesis
MQNKTPLSVVIITKNEQDRIRDCLESVKWAKEIIIVDDFSADRTLDIAKEYTDRIFQKHMELEGAHRNYAYSLASYEWILSLDADERVTCELAEELREIAQENPPMNGYAIPRRNYIGNYWIRHGGWYPAAQIKFGRKKHFKFEESEVHPRLLMLAPRGILKNDIIHYSYKNIGDFVNKMNDQTTREANKWFREGRNVTLFKATWRSVDRFWRAYYKKNGKEDGIIGFILAILGGFYQILSYAKYWQKLNDREGKI